VPVAAHDPPQLGDPRGSRRGHDQRAREKGQDFADGGFVAGGFGQRELRLDLGAVAAAFFVLDHLAGCGQGGDDPAGGAHIAHINGAEISINH
jgi:hypothetical protein